MALFLGGSFSRPETVHTYIMYMQALYPYGSHGNHVEMSAEGMLIFDGEAPRCPQHVYVDSGK